MKIDIDFSDDLLDGMPTDSTFLHLTIICGALKHCLGTSKTMTFIKLAYIFDKTLNLEEGAFLSKITLSPWLISKVFKKSLIIAAANEYLELNAKEGKEIRISITSKGSYFIEKVERLNAFRAYLDYLKEIKLAENRFDNLKFRSEINAHQ